MGFKTGNRLSRNREVESLFCWDRDSTRSLDVKHPRQSSNRLIGPTCLATRSEYARESQTA